MPYYENVARHCADLLEKRMTQEGIRGLVTWRVKKIDRLRQKLRKKWTTEPFSATSSIYEMVHDFAGIRVAPYFPGDQEKIHTLIKSSFDVVETKKFPSERVSDDSDNIHEFDGYKARHFIVRAKSDGLDPDRRILCASTAEIQVASVLMHAWSEVEHDTIYKPLTGELSETELAILDKLNGLVRVGEGLLQILQRTMEQRTAESHRQFKDQFELASYLTEQIRKRESHRGLPTPAMGRIDVLHEFLKLLKKDTPEHVEALVPRLDLKPNQHDSAPVTDQITRMLMATSVGNVRALIAAKALVIRPNLYAVGSESNVDDYVDSAMTFVDQYTEWQKVLTAASAKFVESELQGRETTNGYGEAHIVSTIPPVPVGAFSTYMNLLGPNEFVPLAEITIASFQIAHHKELMEQRLRSADG